MRALFVHDHRYITMPDGRVLSHGQFAAQGWERYLAVFDELLILGRIGQLRPGEDPSSLNVASHPRVRFQLVKDSNTLKGFVTGHKAVRPEINDAVHDCDAIILRGVSELGWLAFQAAHNFRRPIAMEVVADAFEDLWHHGSAAAKAYAPVRLARARAMTGGASHLLYVTERALQERYPPNPNAVVVASASNVEIPDPDPGVLAARLDKIADLIPRMGVQVGVIGNLDHKLKGVDLAMGIAAALPFVHLQVVGPGNPEPYKALAGAARTKFLGPLPSGPPVHQWMKGLDLYVQPSRQEGLPRAVIEAMSEALPVIATDVGGMRELLDPAWIVARDDGKALVARVRAMLDDPTAMIAVARRNFEAAQHYGSTQLSQKRAAFWSGFADYVRRVRGKA